MSLESEITIRVKTLDGQSRDVTLQASSTVGQLKEIIEDKTKMPKNRQRIIYQGQKKNEKMYF